MNREYLSPRTRIPGSDDRWYEVLHTIGRGGNGTTYLVIQSDGVGRGNNFALKYLDTVSEEEREVRFSEEQEFLQSVDHPSILRYYDTGVYEEHPFLIAEYLPKTLADVIRGDPISIPERISYSVQLLSALVHLNSLEPPVIHRDIKPANIFIKRNSCVLGDFGLLKRADGEVDDGAVWRESEPGALPHFYRSPDLVRYAQDEAPLTTKSDVFQLGLVLTELFTGRNPAKRPRENDPLSSVELEEIGYIPGEVLTGSIASLLSNMIEMDPDKRISAEDSMDGWMSLFGNAAGRARSLNGRVF